MVKSPYPTFPNPQVQVKENKNNCYRWSIFCLLMSQLIVSQFFVSVLLTLVCRVESNIITQRLYITQYGPVLPLTDVPSPHPPACVPCSTLVIPQSAVCEAPPSTMFRMVTGWPIREQHLAAGQKQNNSPHAVRNSFMQTSANNCK